ncbi:iron ABC transporter permease [Ectothiorhodospiraceae bacterium 2226]|nr:iron ABC transporter permease [Ectothiorhodospiraceae bacterium 2226]
MSRNHLFLPVLLLLAAASVLLALGTGSIALSPWHVASVLLGGGDELSRSLVLELRMPRILAGFAAGGLLGLAGALMQVLLRNPLADPYVLGVAGGAAVAALLAMLAGLGGLWLTGSAFAGALLSMFLVFGLAHGRGSWTATRLLLTGVVIAGGWGALISFLLALAPDAQLRGMLFWLMGDLTYSSAPLAPLMVLAAAALGTLALARPLNVLTHGALQAQALGVNVNRLQLVLYVLASLLTAFAVTTAGSVGFVGLIVPHIVRLLVGSDHRYVLPGAALLGGILLVLADTLARTAFAPQQLPVGVVTALIGVPVFLFLLQRSAGPSR